MSFNWRALCKALAIVIACATPAAAQFDSAPFRRVRFGGSSTGAFATAVADCSVVSAPKGSLCTDTDDGVLYYKTSTGVSGWTALGSVTPTFTSVALADGTMGAPSLKFTNLTSAGLYLNTVGGASGVGIANKLFVGNGTAAFTSPSRHMDLNNSVTMSSATNYAAAVYTLAATGTGTPSGKARAFEMNAVMSGTAGQSGEITAALFNVGNTTSGTVTEENAGLFAVQRSGGPSTASRGIRIDRNYSSSAAITTSDGIVMSPPAISGGATVTTSRGLVLSNQTVSGATTSRQIDSAHADSGYWHLHSDGSFQSVVNKTSSANYEATANNGRANQFYVNYTGGASSGYHYANYFSVDAGPTAATSGEAWVGLFGGSQGKTAHNVGSIIGVYGGAGTDVSTVDTWDTSGVNGGGMHSFMADTSNYGGAITLADVAGFTAWGGTGASSTTTRFYGFFVPKLYEYSGSITTHVGLQIDDQASSPAANITNNYAIRAGSPSGDTILTATGAWSDAPGTQTIADNGNGGTAATATLTPTTTLVKVTCSDAQGCDETMGETGILDGQIVRITNVSANTVNFADTSGVSETAGAAALGQWDSIVMQYITDRWVEISRSNN